MHIDNIDQHSRSVLVGVDHAGNYRVIVFVQSKAGWAHRWVHDRTFDNLLDATMMADACDLDFRALYTDDDHLADRLNGSAHWHGDEVEIAVWKKEERARRQVTGVLA